MIYHALNRANFRSRLFRTSEKWVSKAVAQFGLENTVRNRGRPKKAPDTSFVADAFFPLKIAHAFSKKETRR
jgi:hypothetical protein